MECSKNEKSVRKNAQYATRIAQNEIICHNMTNEKLIKNGNISHKHME
jgi:hypothetical protein